MKKNTFYTFYILPFLFISSLLFLGTSISFAEEISQEWNSDTLLLKYEYQHFVVKNLDQFISMKTIEEGAREKDSGFCLAEDNEAESDEIQKENSEKTQKISVIDLYEIEQYLEKKIAPEINQEKIDVRIFRDENKNIQFEGVAQYGVRLDVKETAKLIQSAIENDVYYVSVMVEKREPIVTVEDEELKKKGIVELISVGRSNFKGSSYKRVINVINGASKFNGHIVEQGEVFSFTDQLGEIDGSTGYVKELVILGNKVLPEYGGGLCQVSTTSYRAAMLAGMEIIERHNHSYAVSYYEPHGSDATIYVGVKDFKFKNTSDGAILIQTRRGGHNNDELFFHYYGTKPERDIKIFGPLKNNYRSPPAAKVTYDSSRPAGSSQTVSHRVTGFNSQFFRTVTENGEVLYDDRFFSRYQARGTWIIRGGSAPVTQEEEE